MSIEAMKQALDYMQSDLAGRIKKKPHAISALRQAIEQAEKQEPVGEAMKERGEFDYFDYHISPHREWVGLTDEDMQECIKTADYNQGQYKRTPYWAHLSTAIEAKLKEKNK